MQNKRRDGHCCRWKRIKYGNLVCVLCGLVIRDFWSKER